MPLFVRDNETLDFARVRASSSPCRDYPATWRQDSGPKQCRPPFSISGASWADSSGSGHLPEQENPMRDSDSAAGVMIHASFRYLHRVAAGSLRTIYRSDL